MRTLFVLATVLGGLALRHPALGEEQQGVAKKAKGREQEIEKEIKTERDRPQKKERAKAAMGRVEDGIREFGRGVNREMDNAGLGGKPAKKDSTAKPDKAAAKSSAPAEKNGAAPAKKAQAAAKVSAPPAPQAAAKVSAPPPPSK